MSHYETVFILNPVLSENQIEEAVKKYESLLESKSVKLFTKKIGDLRNLHLRSKTKIVVFTICYSSKEMVKSSMI